jgi:hypothetical protein
MKRDLEFGELEMERNVLMCRECLGFWLPILARVVSKVTGVEDYNIVQNNGMFLLFPLWSVFRYCWVGSISSSSYL